MDRFESLTSTSQKQVSNSHGNEHNKWGKVHLWHRMNQLSDMNPSVSWPEVQIEPRTHQLAVKHATTELTGPSDFDTKQWRASPYLNCTHCGTYMYCREWRVYDKNKNNQTLWRHNTIWHLFIRQMPTSHAILVMGDKTAVNYGEISLV